VNVLLVRDKMKGQSMWHSYCCHKSNSDWSQS